MFYRRLPYIFEVLQITILNLLFHFFYRFSCWNNQVNQVYISRWNMQGQQNKSDGRYRESLEVQSASFTRSWKSSSSNTGAAIWFCIAGNLFSVTIWFAKVCFIILYNVPCDNKIDNGHKRHSILASRIWIDTRVRDSGNYLAIMASGLPSPTFLTSAAMLS